MTAPAITFEWNGRAMIPRRTASRLAERSFTSGCAYRMIVQEERRSLEQNAKMWAMLTEIAAQKQHCGRYYAPDQWKALFLHAMGQQVEFLPSLDNATFVPFGLQSSKLSKRDMIELLEFIAAWGTQNGVIFKDDPGRSTA